MSDVPATMWIVLALMLAIRSSTRSAFGAGLAAGAAVIDATRACARCRDRAAGRAPRRDATPPRGDERRRIRNWARHADGDSEPLVRIALFDRLRRRVGVVCDRARHDEPRHFCEAGLHGPWAVMDPRAHRRPDRGAARTTIETRARVWRCPDSIPVLHPLRSLGDTAVSAAWDRSAHGVERRRLDSFRKDATQTWSRPPPSWSGSSPLPSCNPSSCYDGRACGRCLHSRRAIHSPASGSTSTPQATPSSWRINIVARCGGTESVRRCDGISSRRQTSQQRSANSNHAAQRFTSRLRELKWRCSTRGSRK